MAYRFSPDDPSLQQALRRIADEELRAALRVLDNTGLPPQAVHDVRKRAKKLRGLLRLLQGSFPDHARENAALRDAGRLLALRRDAEVRLATFDRLFPGTPKALAPLRRLLVLDRDAPPCAVASDGSGGNPARHAGSGAWLDTDGQRPQDSDAGPGAHAPSCRAGDGGCRAVPQL